MNWRMPPLPALVTQMLPVLSTCGATGPLRDEAVQAAAAVDTQGVKVTNWDPPAVTVW